METYTGRKRVSGAFKKTFTDQEIQTDRIPAYPIMGQCNAQLVGASIKEFVLNPDIFVKAQVAAYERYQPDIIVMQGDLLMEVEAMGNELKFPEDSLCISKKVALEDKRKLSSLELADPQKDGRMPNYLEVLAQAKNIITDSVVSAVIAGPWTIGIGLREADQLLRDAMKDPDYVHELMQLYEANIKNNPSPLPDLKIQYADFSFWQRKWLKGKTLENQVCIASFDSHLGSVLQPVDGVFVPMPPDDVAAGLVRRS